jgi:hypothetical protein
MPVYARQGLRLSPGECEEGRARDLSVGGLPGGGKRVSVYCCLKSGVLVGRLIFHKNSLS